MRAAPLTSSNIRGKAANRALAAGAPAMSFDRAGVSCAKCRATCPAEVEMSLPEITSHDQWLAARKALLAREKELTRARDALNADRRRLPMVRIDKPYASRAPAGEIGLLDLFEGRRQLILQHFMFDPSVGRRLPELLGRRRRAVPRACSITCARATRRSRPSRGHRSRRSRTTRRARAGAFPWYSSYGSDFNYDFHATIDESVAPLEVNYRTRARDRGRRQRGAELGAHAPSSRSSCRASAASCATATPSSTRTRRSHAAPRLSAAGTPSST